MAKMKSKCKAKGATEHAQQGAAISPKRPTPRDAHWEDVALEHWIATEDGLRKLFELKRNHILRLAGITTGGG